jgi:TorA maturation chaperone TorD
MDDATSHAAHHALPPEEQGRADVYGLLAALLLGVDRRVLARLRECGACQADDQRFAQAWTRLVSAAATHTDAQVEAEHRLLVHPAVATRIRPYTSFHVAGALMEKPLAALRSHLHRLGLARARGAGELEDDLAGLCESMRLLIVSGHEPAEQHAFFERHLQRWSARCLDDIRAACPAGFYRAVADLAQAFFDLEAAAFELATTQASA